MSEMMCILWWSLSLSVCEPVWRLMSQEYVRVKILMMFLCFCFIGKWPVQGYMPRKSPVTTFTTEPWNSSRNAASGWCRKLAKVRRQILKISLVFTINAMSTHHMHMRTYSHQFKMASFPEGHCSNILGYSLIIRFWSRAFANTVAYNIISTEY